jgi:spore coat polysaccharide biosynthesis protein SpsF (cytidylyltransferase family)
VAEAVAVEVEVVEAVSKATHMVVPHQLLQQRLLAVDVVEDEVVVLGSEEGEERAFERITRRSHRSIIRGSTRRITRP